MHKPFRSANTCRVEGAPQTPQVFFLFSKSKYKYQEQYVHYYDQE